MEEPHFPGKHILSVCCVLQFSGKKFGGKFWSQGGFASFSLPDWLAGMLFVWLGKFLEEIICCYFVWWLVLDYGFCI